MADPADDDDLSDLGSDAGEEGIIGGVAEEVFEGLREDSMPKNPSLVDFLTSFCLAVALILCEAEPFKTLGFDSINWARRAARALFGWMGAKVKKGKLPKKLFDWLRIFGPIGRGLTDGTIDKLRRDVVVRINGLRKIPDNAARKAALEPYYTVAEGLVTANWGKIIGKKGGDASGGKSDTNTNSGGLTGMGPKSNETISEHMSKLATTDAPRAQAVRDALNDFIRRNDKLGPFILEANMRRLEGVGPDEIVRACEEPTGLQIMDDPEGGAAKVCQREFALKRLALDCKRLVLEARKADGTGPKQTDPAKDGRPAGAIGPKEVDLGVFGKIANPLWEPEPAEASSGVADERAIANARRRREWQAQHRPQPTRTTTARPPRTPRAPINWNLRVSVSDWLLHMLWPPTTGRIIALMLGILVVIGLIVCGIWWLAT